MTTFSWAGRLLPAALARAAALIERSASPRPAVCGPTPAGWERDSFDATTDGDPLSWLGFEPGGRDEPRLRWARPDRWPTGRGWTA